MKKIEAVVRNERFYIVKDALDKMGVKGFLSYQIQGRGAQKGLVAMGGRGGGSMDVAGALVGKTKLEIVCDENEVKKIVDTIASSAKTGQIGDGKIFVSDIGEVIRIRTGETGNNAV